MQEQCNTMHKSLDASQVIDSEESSSDNKCDKSFWGSLTGIPPQTTLSFRLEKDEVHFGRGETNDYVLDHPGISGSHCKIVREFVSSNNYLVWMYDMSTNGTWVDNDKVGKGKKRLLQNGSTVYFLKSKREQEISFVYQDFHKEEVHPNEAEGLFQKYYMKHLLGTGAFSVVKLAVEKETGDSYAIKMVDKKKFRIHPAAKKKNLMDEVNILLDLKHPNILHIHEVLDTEMMLYIVLELVTGGELTNKILKHSKIPEVQAKVYFRQMLDAVKYLHDKGIAHRDLKPENILFKDDKSEIIKLSDFGLSKIVEDKCSMRTMCGTPQYVAPEILHSKATEGYGKSCDLWSLGVILFLMLSGTLPFDDTGSSDLFEQIERAAYDFSEEGWDDVSDEAKELIRGLLRIDPKKRITVDEALQSAWLNEAPTTSSRSRKNSFFLVNPNPIISFGFNSTSSLPLNSTFETASFLFKEDPLPSPPHDSSSYSSDDDITKKTHRRNIPDCRKRKRVKADPNSSSPSTLIHQDISIASTSTTSNSNSTTSTSPSTPTPSFSDTTSTSSTPRQF